MTDTTRTDQITNEQITALMYEAGEHGDFAQVQICERAIEGDNKARDKCAEALCSECVS